MIYVECATEEALAQSVTGLPRKGIAHEFGKGKVLNRLQKARGCIALVDEDPGSNQHSYLDRMTTREDLPERGLRRVYDAARDNYVVLLCPRFEEWLVRAATDAHEDLRSYGLPSEPRKLHQVVNADPRKIEQLLADLAQTPAFHSLRELLRP